MQFRGEIGKANELNSRKLLDRKHGYSNNFTSCIAQQYGGGGRR